MERFFRPLLVVLLVSGLSACSMFSSDEEVVRTPKPLQDIKDEAVQLTEVWSRSIGKGVEARYEHLVPVVDGSAVYVVDAQGAVSALDRQTGKEIWSRKLEGIRVGGGLNVSNDMILLGTLEGEVIALSEKDGSDLWKTRVSSEVLSVPVTDGSVVVVKSIDDKLTALDAKTGKSLWTQDTLQPALTLRGSSAPVIEREAVFSGYSNGDAKAFRLENGAPLWSSRVSAPKGSTELERMVDIDSTPLIVGDTLFVASYQGNVAGLDLYSGRVRWSKEVSSYSPLAEGFGSLYVTDQDSFVSSLDQRTGASSWRQEGLQYRGLTAPATFSSYVVVGDYQGYIHLLSQVDGSLSGRFKAGSSPIRAQPQVDGDMLYVLNTSGKLMALRKR